MTNSSVEDRAQKRPSVAAWRRTRTLRATLTSSVVFSVAVVITLVVMVSIRLAQNLLESDLRQTAQVTAAAVADEVELYLDSERPAIEPLPAIEPVLHDFMRAAPSLRTISVYEPDANGSVVLLASTSSAPPAPAELIARTIHSRAAVWEEGGDQAIARVAAPIQQDDKTVAAVVVSVSMAPVEQLRRGGRILGAAAIVVAVIGITLLIHLLASRLIYGPVGNITGTMEKVTGGNLSARATVRRDDEIGRLAVRLNKMLTELEELHASLNERVTAATAALRERNEELTRSYERVLELRRTLARAEQLAAIGQTMANVAHQIGTPLNLVSGHVQLLKQEAADPALQRRLRIVEEQIERVASSVRALLEHARPEAVEKPVDVPAVLARLVDAIRPQVEPAGIQLAIDVPSALPPIVVDETAFELALLNVLVNAADAMPRGGTLSLAASESTGRVRIVIRDTGAGITPDLLPRIFEPWVTTKGPRGTGLGLSVAREVVERAGGTIEVASRPGDGAVFTIELPADQPMAERKLAG